MEWGRNIALLEKQLEESGVVPQALLKRPYLTENLQLVLDAFNFLGMYRSWREGIPDPILFSDAKKYVNLYHVTDSDQVLEFCELLTVCDMTYVSHYIKEANRKIELAKKNK